MTDDLSHLARAPKPLLPAWMLSIAIHGALIAMLWAAFQDPPRGVESAQRGSIGIVLNRASADGNIYGGESQKVQQPAAPADDPVPPNLLAAAKDANKSTTAKSADKSANSSKTAASGTNADVRQNATSRKSNPRPNYSGGKLGSPGGSGYAQVSVFGVQGKGSKFIYVFDRSASMEGRPLAAAKQQLLQSLESLESVHQFHIMFFNTKTQSFDLSGGGRRIAFATQRNKKLAANFVGGITADGGTDRFVALREAITFAPDVIFFLTDADDPMSAAEMAGITRANHRVEAAICVIEFGKNPAPAPNNFLARLAQQSGGQYGYVDTTKLLAQQPAGGPLLPQSQ
jgi:hypothetical protein